MDAPPPIPDAQPPRAAPPTVPGPICAPQSDRLPGAAKVVAILGIALGFAGVCAAYVFHTTEFPWPVVLSVYLVVGMGVLMRSNTMRVLARVAYGLAAFLLIAFVVFAAYNLLIAGGLIFFPIAGLTYLLILAAWPALFTVYFVLGFYVLGRADVRRACQRPRP